MIGEHDRLTIGGKAFRLAYMSGSGAVLKPVESAGVAEIFASDHLNASRKIAHEVEYCLHENMRSARQRIPDFSFIGPVTQAARDRMDTACAMA
ncbi:hypothetical protein [Paenirhodobacter sp.]|uniref:hypothetical protein n=1 Tax=Paenirhodobacter sp. TaxID=1965326 RepID=UPI003B406EAF